MVPHEDPFWHRGKMKFGIALYCLLSQGVANISSLTICLYHLLLNTMSNHTIVTLENFSLPEVRLLIKTRYLPHLSLPVGGKPPRALSWKHRSWSRPVKGLCRPQNYHCYLPGPWVTLQGATITTKGIKNLDASRWYVFVSSHLKESATRMDLCSFCLASYTTQGCHAVGRYIAWQPTLTLITIKPDENFASKSKVEEISKCCFVLLHFHSSVLKPDLDVLFRET